MATVVYIYDKYRLKNFNGAAINMELPGGNGIKAALVTSAYVPNQNTDEFWSTPQASEVTGGSYTAGGNVLANGIVTLDAAGLVTVDFADPAAWAQDALGFTNARRVIIYHDDGVAAASSKLIAFSADFGVDRNNVDGPFSIVINLAGLITSPR